MAKAKRKQTATDKRLGLAHKSQVSTYLDHGQIAALDALAKLTKCTKSTLFREAIDDLLAKYKGAK